MQTQIEQPHRELQDDLRVLRINRRSIKPKKRVLPKRVTLLSLALMSIIVVSWLAMRFDVISKLGLNTRTVRVTTAARPQSSMGQSGSQPLLSAGGYVIARTQVEVGSKTIGRVVSLESNGGDFVRQGQIVARLDDSEIQAQLRQGQAALAAAKARLAELLAGSRPQEINRASADTDRLAADMKNAERAYQRSTELARAGVIAQQELEDSRARYEMAVAAHRSAQESLKLTRVGARFEEIQGARAEVSKAEAELAIVQAQAENTVIRAPISGTVLERYVEVGEMVTTGFTSDRGAKQALLTIADLKDLQVEMDVSEADIAKVQLQQPVRVVPDAYADHSYEGVVDYVGSAADRQKATVKVKVRVLGPDQFLRPNLGAKVTFYPRDAEMPREKETAVRIPKAALFTRDGQASVFVAKDQKALVQRVTVGREVNGEVEILEGLSEGESVILDAGVSDGEKITIQP
jgi:HlyD family secretion protein